MKFKKIYYTRLSRNLFVIKREKYIRFLLSSFDDIYYIELIYCRFKTLKRSCKNEWFISNDNSFEISLLGK